MYIGVLATPPTKVLAAMMLFEILTPKFYRVTKKHSFILQHFLLKVKFDFKYEKKTNLKNLKTAYFYLKYHNSNKFEYFKPKIQSNTQDLTL